MKKKARYYQIRAIATACHEANRRYCQSIGDDSQPSWDEAPDWQQKSAEDGVRGILSGKIQNPEQSHESWLRVKEDDGWVYGEVKDPESKTHPCMVPYADLPLEQIVKDDIFFTTVRTCARALGIVDDNGLGKDWDIVVDDENPLETRITHKGFPVRHVRKYSYGVETTNILTTHRVLRLEITNPDIEVVTVPRRLVDGD